MTIVGDSAFSASLDVGGLGTGVGSCVGNSFGVCVGMGSCVGSVSGVSVGGVPGVCVGEGSCEAGVGVTAMAAGGGNAENVTGGGDSRDGSTK